MGLFRGPLALFALSMLVIGPGTFLLRRSGRTLAANLTLAAAAAALLLCRPRWPHPLLPHPRLKAARPRHPRRAAPPPSPRSLPDLILIDGELTSGSTLLFYTQQPVHLVNGRVNGPWYGSFWPDAPPIFETEASLRTLWSSPRRLFLLTYHPQRRTLDLAPVPPSTPSPPPAANPSSPTASSTQPRELGAAAQEKLPPSPKVFPDNAVKPTGSAKLRRPCPGSVRTGPARENGSRHLSSP